MAPHTIYSNTTNFKAIGEKIIIIIILVLIIIKFGKGLESETFPVRQRRSQTHRTARFRQKC